ncbi:MAG: sterol carrier family protein [Micrococcaceae bacterium]
MARGKISNVDGEAAILAYKQGDKTSLPTVTRYLLLKLSSKAPGNSVEVRVPPYAVTQCIAGQNHRRGTPPNVVEMKPEIWVALALGEISWDSGIENGEILASGVRANISNILPIKVN